MKKGSGTFFVYKRFCRGSMQNGKQERVKAGYHYDSGILPLALESSYHCAKLVVPIWNVSGWLSRIYKKVLYNAI